LFGVAVPGGKKKGIGAPRLRLAPTWTPHWSGQTAFWDPVLASGLLRVCIGFWKIGGGSGHGYLGGVVCSLSLRGTRGGVYIYFSVFFLAYSRWIDIFHIEYIITFTHAKVLIPEYTFDYEYTPIPSRCRPSATSPPGSKPLYHPPHRQLHRPPRPPRRPSLASKSSAAAAKATHSR
jgi:hypothetical protein